MNRDRFPALGEGWARLDGPAGGQVVDRAIEAMADWMRSGSQANHGGQFKQARETDELVESTRTAVATLLGGEPSGVTFGPSFTALTMRFAATVVREREIRAQARSSTEVCSSMAFSSVSKKEATSERAFWHCW